MKTFFYVAAFFAIVSCSSNKEAQISSVELINEQSSVKSYGPQGRIIYAEEAAEMHQKVATDAKEVHFLNNGNPEVEFANSMQKSTHLASKSGQQKESNLAMQNSGLRKTSDRNALKEWEPYRDQSKTGEKKKNGFAIAGFVLSFFVYFFPLAIVFSAIGLKSEKRGLAIAGLVLSCLIGAVIIAALIYNFVYF